jgi:hypothetical protein
VKRFALSLAVIFTANWALADDLLHTGANKAEAPKPPLAAYLTVVDVDGKPLAQMTPIITLTPNAFDKPIASGPPTNADGKSAVQFKSDKTVFLRAWDPKLAVFPNNFFEIKANSGEVAKDMIVVMMKATSFRVALILPDGAPAAKQNVGLMMFHPTKGPWWPGEADTDENGVAQFAPVPPGIFNIKIKVESGPMAELTKVTLQPDNALDLGPVQLAATPKK